MDHNKQVIAKEDLFKLAEAFNTLPVETVYDVAYSCKLDMLKTISMLRELTSANNDGYQNAAYGGVRKKTGQPVPAKLVERANYIRIIELINEGFKVLVLMRGLPGSGKSTLAREILHKTLPTESLVDFIFSADDFFKRNGKYKYDVTKLDNAHHYCQERCYKAMIRGLSPIIIDNTNIKQWEMQAYCAMGVQFGYCIEICEPETPWARDPEGLSRKNSHSVQKPKIITMLNNFESEVTTQSMLRDFKLGYQCPMPQKRMFPPLVSRTNAASKVPSVSRPELQEQEDEEMRLVLELSLKEAKMPQTNNNFVDEYESPYEKKLPPIMEYIHKPSKITSSNINSANADSKRGANIDSTQKEYVHKFHAKPLEETPDVKNDFVYKEESRPKSEPLVEPTPQPTQDNNAMSLIDFSEETPTSASNMTGHFPLMPVQVQSNTSANSESNVQNKKMKSNDYEGVESSPKQTNVNANLGKSPEVKPQDGSLFFGPNLPQNWNTQTPTNTKQPNVNTNLPNPKDLIFGPNLDALQSWNTQQSSKSVAPKVNNDDLSLWGTSITELQSWDSTLPLKSTSEPTITITRKISPEVSAKNVQMSDKQTNTSVDDFNFALTCPEKSARGVVLMGTNRPINANNVVVKVSLRSKITVDVGCMTEEDDLMINGLDHNADHVAKLREFFPHIPIEYMLEVYEKCQKDINWTMELLAETDYIPALPKPKETKPEPMELPSKRDNSTETTPINSWDIVDPLQEMIEKLKKEDEMMKLKRQLEENVTFKREHYSDHTWEIKNIKQGGGVAPQPAQRQEEREDPKKADSTSDSDENSDDAYNEETNKLFQVDLGAVLVGQLEKICGNEEKLNQRFSTVVQMPESMARQLHALYLESICLQIENQSLSLSGDEELAKQIQEEEHNSKEPDLKRIMDEQLAEFLQQKDMQQYKNISPDDLATRLTRLKLYEAFPTLRAAVVDDVLSACSYNYKDAVFVLINSVEKNTIQGKGNLMDPPISEGTLQEMKSEKAMIEKNLDDDEAASAARTAQSFRDEANECLNRHKHLQELVNMYHQKGMGEVAVFYSELARKAQQQLDYANQKASYLYMYENSAKLNDGITLDLHYLFVKEAVTALDVFVDHQVQQLIKQNKRHGDFFVITGRGNRSSNGKSKIKPAVMQRLRKRQIKFCEINPGLLKIKLHPNLAMDTDI